MLRCAGCPLQRMKPEGILLFVFLPWLGCGYFSRVPVVSGTLHR